MKEISTDFLVIGSGASAVGALQALITAKTRPLVVDSGSLQDSVRDAVAGTSQSPKHSARKTWFGSDAVYQQHRNSHLIFPFNYPAVPSNFFGGFTRVWGATVEFWNFEEEWAENQKPNPLDMSAITKLLDPSTTPLSHDSVALQNQNYNPRIKKIFSETFENSKKRGWSCEPSRLAISNSNSKENACRYSSKCITGCPNDSIWYAGKQILNWIEEKKIDFQGGIYVERIISAPDHQIVEAVDSEGNTIQIKAKRVFLAAGAIATAEIAIKSGVVDLVGIRDTRTIFTAAFSLRKPADLGQAHALSQFWVRDKRGIKFQAQIYASNPELLNRLTSKFKLLAKIPRIATWFNQRLYPVIAYVDERVSPPFSVRKKQTGGIEVFSINSRRHKLVAIYKLLKLSRLLLSAGLFLPIAGTEIGKPGAGFHFGSSFPMGESSSPLGEISGWRGVSIVDSSVLPYLDVGSITPTVMANAHRIARLVSGGIT